MDRVHKNVHVLYMSLVDRSSSSLQKEILKKTLKSGDQYLLTQN